MFNLADDLTRRVPPALGADGRRAPALYAGQAVPAGDLGRGEGGAVGRFLTFFAYDRSGASALEYGLVVGLVALALIAGMGFAGNVMSNMYTFIATELSNLMANA